MTRHSARPSQWVPVGIAAIALPLTGAGLLVWATLPAALSKPMAGALQAALIIALATAAGALPALLIRRWTTALRDTLMGFSAGIMLGAIVFTLTLPALAEAGRLWPPAEAALWVALALLAGAAVLWLADRLLPHAQESGDAPEARQARGVWLVVMAMGLHHVPEGFAVGASFGASDELGRLTALGIGVQSVPEGLIVAAGLRSIGHGAGTALGVAVLTGLAQPLGAGLGVWLSGLGQVALPLMLAAAGGAMMFVISHEVIPQSHRSGNESPATFALISGFVAMMVLALALSQPTSTQGEEPWISTSASTASSAPRSPTAWPGCWPTAIPSTSRPTTFTGMSPAPCSTRCT